MKIHIELVGDLDEDEVIIRCGRVDDTIQKIHQYILEQTQSPVKLTFFKDNEEFYFPLDDVLFFETEGERIYAHTSGDAFRIKYRLYELEDLLPMNFVRASKSAIVNTRNIYSVTRNLTASSLIRFAGSHKQVYVSRYYYKDLRQRLNPQGRPSSRSNLNNKILQYRKGFTMKHNNWFWGVFFVLAAVFVIATQIPSSFAVIGFWSIAAAVLLAAVFIQSLVRLNFFGVFLSLAIAYMLFHGSLALPWLSPWLLLLAAVLLSIGFHIIFGRSHKRRYEQRHGDKTDDGYRTIEDVDGNNPTVKVSFGSSSKYIHADTLKSGRFSCSFGSLSVYFDQAQLASDGADLYVDCSFGEIKLFFPREWNVVDNLTTSLGGIRNDSRADRVDSALPAVTLTGGASFGSIEINRV